MQWTNYNHHTPVLWHNHGLIVKSCFVCCSNKYWFTGLFYVLSRLIARLTEQQFRLQSTCFIWEIISCWINCYFAFLVILFFWYSIELCSVSYCVCSVEQPVHTDCHFCATHVYIILVCGVALLPIVLVMQQPARVSGKSLLHTVEMCLVWIISGYTRWVTASRCSCISAEEFKLCGHDVPNFMPVCREFV